MNLQTLIRSAILCALALATVAPVYAADEMEKCFGVSRAGKNDCAGSTHGRAGQSKMDDSTDDWKMVAEGACEKMGGKMAAPAKK